MLAGPSSQLPFRTIERLFLTSCLLANLIFAGTFQVNSNLNRTTPINHHLLAKSYVGLIDDIVQYCNTLQRH